MKKKKGKMNNQNNNQIQINIDQDKIEAKYADQVMISHNPFGFTFDFAQQISPMNMIKILSRVAMSPEHAKAFGGALMDNLSKYEKQFGEIKISAQVKEEATNKKIGFYVEEKKSEK